LESRPRGRPPDLLLYLLAGEDPPGAAHEEGQQVKLLGGKPHLLLPEEDLPPLGVKGKLPHREDLAPLPVPKLDLDAGQKLGGVEGLDQVVVGPFGEEGDLALHGVLGGEDQDGGVIGGADPPGHLAAVHVGEAQVQDHQVGPLLPVADEALHAAFGPFHGEARLLQFQQEKPRHLGVVLYEEDALHGQSLSGGVRP
jgi:hypothetical protein